MKLTVLTLIFILIFPLGAFSEEKPEKHVGRAVTETVSSNILLLGFNRFVTDQEYARISLDSMHDNLTGEWVWDQDEFSVNQIGHPYQGSFYFAAGRANNLNFWESYLLTTFGSISWEYLFETETPSKNDLIVTTMGGASTGEMLHRIYHKAYWSRGHWLSFFISPMDAINSLISGEKPKRDTDHELDTDTSVFIGSSVSNGKDSVVTAGLGIDLVYGNPFGLDTRIPFEHFELSLLASYAHETHFLSLFSDGLLRSWAPFMDLNSATTIGIGMHYDFIFSEYINYSANSLGLTLKRRNFLENDFIFDIKLHLNWLVLGSSEYPYFINGDIPKPDHLPERRQYDIGTGENAKLYMDLSSPVFGTLSLWGSASGIHTIDNAVPEEGSDGFIFVGNAGISYERIVKGKFRVGLRDNFYYKLGIYDSAKDSDHYLNTFSIYIKVRS